jgi:hypothetical protein
MLFKKTEIVKMGCGMYAKCNSFNIITEIGEKDL